MLNKKIVASLCVLCSIVAVWIAFDPASASTIIQPAYNLVQNAGSNLLRRTTINFHGAGVTASDMAGVTDVNIPGGAGGYNLVQNAGTPLTMRTTLNCTGSITCSDDPLNMVTILNGSGGGSGNSVVNITPVTVSANTTSDQTLMELSLTAGYLNTLASPFLINAAGIYTTASGQTPTLTFKVKLCTVSGCGSGTVVTLTSIPSLATLSANSNNPWNFSFLSYTSTTGAMGNVEIHGPLAVDLGALPSSAAAVFNDENTAVSSNIDLTAALFIDFTVATSTGNAGNSITQRAGAIMPFAASANSGGGGSTRGTFASRPACMTAGSTYYSTDVAIVSECDGMTWFDSAYGYAVVLPSSSSFTWQNQGGATVTTNGIESATFPTSGGDSLRGRFVAYPATPFTMDACFLGVNGFNNGNAAFGIYSSDGTKLVTLFVDLSGNMEASNWNSVTSFSGDIRGPVNYVPRGATICMRWMDDGTTTTLSRSTDMQTWIPFATQGSTAFLTATNLGYFGDFNGQVDNSVVTLISFNVH